MDSKNQIILDLITKAKDRYLDSGEGRYGMYEAFKSIVERSSDLEEKLLNIIRDRYPNRKIHTIEDEDNWIHILIPEFDPYILNGKSSLFNDNRDYYKHYWWELSDKESRIKAFDKLIEIYRAKV